VSHRRTTRREPRGVTRLTPVGRAHAGYPQAVTTTSPLVNAGTTAVRLASRLRRERAIHPRGRAFRGTVVLPGGAGTGAPLLDEAGTYDAVVRFSRSAGLPRALPDVYGLAVRLVDAHGPGAHQDLLLDSTQPAPLLRRLPWPRWCATSAVYSSLLPYSVGGRRLLVGARAVPGTPAARSLTALPDRLELALLVATAHGAWREVGRVRTTGVLPAPQGRQTRFTPAHTGGGLSPAGPFQEWRTRAYPASHVAPDEQ
jgi:hypothetical protein